MSRTYGAKYDETRDLEPAAVAKLVRADLKAAANETGVLSGLKFSVRTEQYAMGWALRIEVDGLADDEIFYGVNRRTPRANAVCRAVDAITGAYNFDGSDIYTDYSDVRFHANATLVTERDREFTARVKATRRAGASR